MNPQDLERVILGSLVMRPNYLELEDLNSGDFSSPRFRKVFEIISDLWETDRPEEISLPVLAGRLHEDHSELFVSTLIDGLYQLSPEQFRQNAAELKWLRGTREIGRELSRELALEERTGAPDRAAWERIFERVDGLRRSTDKRIRAVLRPLSEIEPQSVSWTWPNRIPRGKLTLIVGDPGLGKSFFCVDLAARISRGREWPDSQGRADQGSVLLLTAEDGLADTVRLRADSAGADVSRIIVLEGIQEAGGIGFFNLARHIPILENVLKERPDLSLIVIDPISAYLGDLDSHKNAEVRGALAPLSALAEKTNVSIIGVSHLNKSTSSEKAVYRVMGSLSFVAAARACWGVIKDPDDPEQERRLFVPVKTNLSIKPTSLIFRISDGRLEYESKPVQLDADVLLNARTEDREEQNFADSWLQDFLQSGPQEVKEIRREAVKDGVSKSALYRAAKRLGLGRSASGFGKFRSSTWELKK
jgi:putative DNA primase/helicase